MKHRRSNGRLNRELLRWFVLRKLFLYTAEFCGLTLRFLSDSFSYGLTEFQFGAGKGAKEGSLPFTPPRRGIPHWNWFALQLS
jgi:hypothetical protein